METAIQTPIFQVKFRDGLYNLSAIKDSVEEFSDFFSTDVSVSEGYIEVTFRFYSEMDMRVVREFCNYVLGVMQNSR